MGAAGNHVALCRRVGANGVLGYGTAQKQELRDNLPCGYSRCAVPPVFRNLQTCDTSGIATALPPVIQFPAIWRHVSDVCGPL